MNKLIINKSASVANNSIPYREQKNEYNNIIRKWQNRIIRMTDNLPNMIYVNSTTREGKLHIYCKYFAAEVFPDGPLIFLSILGNDRWGADVKYLIKKFNHLHYKIISLKSKYATKLLKKISWGVQIYLLSMHLDVSNRSELLSITREKGRDVIHVYERTLVIYTAKVLTSLGKKVNKKNPKLLEDIIGIICRVFYGI